MKVGKMLKVLREHAGWTQVELAERAGVTQNFISKIEAGKQIHLSFVSLAKILVALEAGF